MPALDTKGLLQSRAFIGLLVLFLGAMLERFGYVIVDKESTVDAVMNLVSVGMEFVGAALSAWGTIHRKTIIDGIIKFD